MKFNYAALAVAGSIIALGAPAYAQTEIKIGYALAPDSHYGVAAQKFAAQTAVRFAGRFAVSHTTRKSPGKSNALSNPSSSAIWRMLLP